MIEWRSPTRPHWHQYEFKRWRRGQVDGQVHENVLLEAGLGLGKSLSGIEEILELITHRSAAQVLVLARHSNLRTVWEDQLKTHAPNLKYIILDCPRVKRQALLDSTPSDEPIVWVHDREDLPAFGKILAGYEWDMIVIDECAGFRTASAARTKLLTNYRQPRLDADFKLAMSGLPMIKHATDLYPILRWLGAWRVQRPNGSWKPGNKQEFINRFLIVDGRGQELVVKDPVGLTKLLNSCRYQVPKSAVLNIPRSFRYDRLKLPDWQQKSYNFIRRELKVRLTNPETGRLEEAPITSRLTEMLRLCQVTAGFEALDQERWIWHDDNVKTRHLIDVVMPELDGEKAIIWTAFHVECSNVTRLINAAGYRAVAYYGGSERNRQNQEGYDLFKSGKADVFVSTLAKGSAGLNLPEASVMTYHSRTPDTEAVLQSLDRNYRLTTQHAHLSVIILEAENTFDERISEIIGDDTHKASQFTSISLESVLG
jgi:SNF2 domain-containing protein/helicase-like protein